MFKVVGGVEYGAIRSYVGAASGDSYMSFLTTTDSGANLVQQMTIQHDGNVGIGTGSPVSLLDLSGPATDKLRLHSTDGGGEGLSIEWNSTFSNRITADIESDASGGGGNFQIRVSDTNEVLQPRLHIDNAGNVGIGTASPFASPFNIFTGLEVVGTDAVVFVNGSSTATLFLRDAGSGADLKNFDIANTGGITHIRAINDDLSIGKYFFSLNHTAGIVGIGLQYPKVGRADLSTPSIGAMLEIRTDRANGENATALVLSDGVTGAQTPRGGMVIQFSTSGGAAVSEIKGAIGVDGTNNQMDLIFSTQASAGGLTERMIINDDGNVGIGLTGSPGNLLHVEAQDGVMDNTWVAVIRNKEATDDRSHGILLDAGSTANDDAFRVRTHDGGSELFVIQGDGKVGIGTTGPGYTLSVDGDIQATGSIRITGANEQYYWSSTNAAAGTAIVHAANGYFYRLDSSEDVKKNIVRNYEVPDYMDFLNVSPMKFDYKTDDPKSDNLIGFSAEELFASGLPHLVNVDLDGKPVSIREQAILAYHHLIIKEQQTQIDLMKTSLCKLGETMWC